MKLQGNRISIGPEGGAGGVVNEGEGEELRTGSAVVVEDDDAVEGAPKKAMLPARATLNDDGTVTLTLVRPITLTINSGSGKSRQQTYSDLVFHELTGLDLRQISQTPEAMQTVMALARATRMTSIRMNVLFDLLSSRDVKAASEIITFLSE